MDLDPGLDECERDPTGADGELEGLAITGQLAQPLNGGSEVVGAEPIGMVAVVVGRDLGVEVQVDVIVHGRPV